MDEKAKLAEAASKSKGKDDEGFGRLPRLILEVRLRGEQCETGRVTSKQLTKRDVIRRIMQQRTACLS